ncbi:MAG: beta-hydroxyacyl-ACP dehydratase [Planctomycetes bacterium]|nr:beta-hydroxyacyl-ACP dehydratase [Planctomycetota bacterium]MBZ0150550.1 beta-hydroxyacyl-ACP dehydratase [Planctomycetota bacterium]MCC7398712.1 beta-hydroxyacyl-ACP dehydratase [Planctomycetota bacterium]
MGQPIVDLASLDLSQDVVPVAELRRCLPHRDVFQLLDGICYFDRERLVCVGYKDWDANPWWATGHIPGRPIMPGVLMIEGAAQSATFLVKQNNDWAVDRMIGLAGLDNARFRGQVVPPARVYFVSELVQLSGRRLAKMHSQVFCNGQMTLELDVMGVML